MRLAELAEIRMGYPFRSRLEHEPDGNVAVIQMKDIDDADLLHAQDAIRVSLPDVKARHLLRQGDLVFRSRGRSNSVALVASPVMNAVLAAPMLLIRPRHVLPAYLHWHINLRSTQTSLAAQAEGTAVRMISKAALESLEVPVPDWETQRRIVETAGLAHREHALMAEIASKRKWLMERILASKAQEGTK